MKIKTIYLVVILLLAALASVPGHTEEALTVGLHAGFSAKDVDGESFQQYQLYAAYPLPWRWESDSGWTLAILLNGTGGILRGGGETGFIGSLGPALVLGKQGIPVSLELGSSPTVLSQSRFGDADLGGTFHFTSHLGLHLQIGATLDTGYRYQHMSNASTQDPNPGLNMHLFWLGYRF